MSNESPPAFEQGASGYGAEQTRRAIYFMLQRGSTIGSVAGGIVAATDCVTTGAGSSMAVSVAAGEVIPSGSSSATQSGYYCRVSSADSLSISASDPSNPRIDTVIAQVQDAAYTGASNAFAPAIISGTATSGATLANLDGAGAVPASSLVLAYVLVPAGSTVVTTAHVLNVASLVCDSLPSYAYVNGSGATTAVSGQWVEMAGGYTCTLPAPVANSTVAITAKTGVSGSSQVTVAAGASGAINGAGLSSASSFKLGTPGAYAILEADGSNWNFVAGQQDTGWVALTPVSGVTASAITTGGVTTYAGTVRLQGNTIRLRGALWNETGSGISPGGTIATIPSGSRPAAGVFAWVAGDSSSPLPIEILSSGVIAPWQNTLANGVWITLDSVPPIDLT